MLSFAPFVHSSVSWWFSFQFFLSIFHSVGNSHLLLDSLSVFLHVPRFECHAINNAINIYVNVLCTCDCVCVAVGKQRILCSVSLIRISLHSKFKRCVPKKNRAKLLFFSHSGRFFSLHFKCWILCSLFLSLAEFKIIRFYYTHFVSFCTMK